MMRIYSNHRFGRGIDIFQPNMQVEVCKDQSLAMDQSEE
jgi:hypothetical protein